MEDAKVTSSKKIKTVIQAEEEHLGLLSTKKVLKKKSTKTENADGQAQSSIETHENNSSEKTKKTSTAKKTKSKVKKAKNNDADTQNISVKKSFSKFDELQKKHLVHSPQDEKLTNCRVCSKPVYKMEEIKAEKSIFHRNCFRCKECNKSLKVDNYQSHEGVLYCLIHFKLLFAPKAISDFEQEKPHKAELIIRENEPEELPPDVVRASSKPDLGLEELQLLNVRSRFEIFENGKWQKEHEDKNDMSNETKNPSKKSASIVSKLVKLKQHGCFLGENNDDLLEGIDFSEGSSEGQPSETDDDDDMVLVRSKKCTQRERPIGLGDAMNDIKSRFESGHAMTKEERREERKQEIQNIRSRLFMGKQARIKEMYQQAVAESEHGTSSADKKPHIEINCAASDLKKRFENGEIFKDSQSEGKAEEKLKHGAVEEDAEVFESAISKKSRSIFMELDANVAACKNKNVFVKRSSSIGSKWHNNESEQENICQDSSAEVVKYDEKPEDCKIETSEISQKFKFFETFRPQQVEKKQFRITPPREGVVKMPTPDSDEELCNENSIKKDNILEKSQTTSLMLNKFREMEQNKFNRAPINDGPRPLKCFTPPPDGGKCVYPDQESDLDSEEEEGEEENEEGSDEDAKDNNYDNDTALREAQLAARAKILRAKFEKWQSSELHKDELEGPIDIYSNQVSDDTSIESTKTLRERFENMNKLEEKAAPKNRYQVNRFI